MATQNGDSTKRLESRSLGVAMWGNLFMAAAGLVAGVLSNSNAIMMDGLFSLIGFGSALLGRRISRRIDAGPDKARPYGYAADEAIFSTFRSLSLLGLVLFAITNAIKNVYNYLSGMTPEPLNFAPMIIYFAGIGLVCAILWGFHHFTWRRTGKRSAILRLEAKAAMFDGLITAAAGAGLGAIYLFRDGPLAPVAPVGDSVIVLLLCLLAIGSYVREFRGGLGELAGASARPEYVATARRSLRSAIAEDGGELQDMSVTKLGRTFLVTVYYDPRRPMSASDIDKLNLRMIEDARKTLTGADVLLLITEHPRRWPDALNPF
ncbi:cation transporter [Phaeobacter gallaeciensis]|uniref:cation transporter n=1 Tax=Phaeobacter gallaeciensis TaxID=60890 RepID=UPI00237F83F4|nr:cation transporter [Phaeobacter gallaeciensis]MDE4305476.1 cation transporter [Phaeobacter gallaeciensis]MDE4309824.1 cation transporter [Phaeobacter gallaeciensis]MDE4314281.1 cation transporter [Phaeobacter gallaeciensis]MDE4318876.1 cation transporter [Phaeobacter gallaeciensis]MDE4323038.1 cation transporter [Phaeobacter gallaeciensis]